MLSATPEADDRTADRGSEARDAVPDNPGLRILDALGAGDDAAVLELCGPTTRVSAENMGWSCEGRDEIQLMLIVARERFRDLTFESRTRQVGFGVVMEEARVRDVPAEAAPEKVGADEGGGGMTEGHDHPMYDDPTSSAESAGRALVLWRDLGGDEPPAPLNMPVRVTVRHDDLQVHEVSLSFPAALLRRALGERVDPFELSLSEVQSAFVAPAEAEPSTPGISVHGAPTRRTAEAARAGHGVANERRPRRRRWWLPVALVVLAAAAAGIWWVVGL